MKCSISTMICINTSQEKVTELIDYYTMKGEIVLISCFNILDNSHKIDDFYLNMDKEKINMSDKLIVFGEVSSADYYVYALIEYAKYSGKSIQYENS